MFNIELKEGQIFEINRNTGITYLYTDGMITEISPLEYNIIHCTEVSKRGIALKEFRMKMR
jgi:hypothetical protein